MQRDEQDRPGPNPISATESCSPGCVPELQISLICKMGWGQFAGLLQSLETTYAMTSPPQSRCQVKTALGQYARVSVWFLVSPMSSLRVELVPHSPPEPQRQAQGQVHAEMFGEQLAVQRMVCLQSRPAIWQLQNRSPMPHGGARAGWL